MTDDLTPRLLAAIEAEAQRDAHDRECLLFSNANDGWCDKGCRERTERHYVAHRKIVELHGPIDDIKGGECCVVCALWDDDGMGYRSGAWPCATLVALAEGYDLTTEPAS